MKKFLLIILSLLLTGIIGYGAYYLKYSPSTDRLTGIAINVIEEEGVQPFMKESDILTEMAQLGLNYKGMLIDSIDVSYVEEKLKQNPLFKDVEVYITPFSKEMKVDIRQQQALFLVHNGNKHYYISKSRETIPLNPKYVIYTPIVTGEVSEETAKTDIYDLVKAIETDTDLQNSFSQIHVDSKKGIILTLRSGSMYAILGQSKNWHTMLHKYKIFTQEVTSKLGNNAYEYINLAFNNQVIALPKNWQNKPNISASE